LLIPLDKVIADLQAIGFPRAKIDRWLADAGEVKLYSEAYTRYIGAGAVTMAGHHHAAAHDADDRPLDLESFRALGRRRLGEREADRAGHPDHGRAFGALGLTAILALLPILPGDFKGKLMMAVLILGFGFLFVTVSSRIVGLIGSSSNPISGMTIATLLGTALVFLAMGLNAPIHQPIALSVGAIVCIAAANAGATSQDLKTGFLVGATPIRQQVGLVIGVVVSTIVIGLTVKFLDGTMGVDKHAIGDKFPAPQATLMATVIKGVMAQNLPWGYILVGRASR
jgi:uncharacterized oligopeptide transporter (OPT) family protein